MHQNSIPGVKVSAELSSGEGFKKLVNYRGNNNNDNKSLYRMGTIVKDNNEIHNIKGLRQNINGLRQNINGLRQY